MGRYTTVQIYSDSNPSMRSVPYDQAVGGGASAASTNASTEAATAVAKVTRPEKVDNPSGSTSGAGSGEFHVYRAARAREKLRIQQMDAQEAERMEQAEFYKKNWENQTSEAQKTEKRRKKRQREKMAKMRKKNMKLNGVVSVETEIENDDTRKKEDLDDEFQYTSTKRKVEHGEIKDKPDGTDSKKTKVELPDIEIKNDGSFLEMMKKKMAEMSQTADSS